MLHAINTPGWWTSGTEMGRDSILDLNENPYVRTKFTCFDSVCVS